MGRLKADRIQTIDREPLSISDNQIKKGRAPPPLHTYRNGKQERRQSAGK